MENHENMGILTLTLGPKQSESIKIHFKQSESIKIHFKQSEQSKLSLKCAVISFPANMNTINSTQTKQIQSFQIKFHLNTLATADYRINTLATLLYTVNTSNQHNQFNNAYLFDKIYGN
jgi:hypothetical protein